MDQFASNIHPFFLKGSSYEKYKKILKIDIIRDHVTKNVTRVEKKITKNYYSKLNIIGSELTTNNVLRYVWALYVINNP